MLNLLRFSLLIVCFSLIASVVAAVEPRGMVYDFGASWCGPCRQMLPVVEKLEHEGLPIQKVDIDQQKDLANQFRIDRVPTFVLVIDGQEVDRVTGGMTEADLRRMVARIPKAPRQPQTQSPANSRSMPSSAAGNLEFPVALGEPGPITRPEQNLVKEETIEQPQDESPLKRLWPFKKDDAPTVRGNDDTHLVSTTQEAAFDPMAASVRIRVIIGNKVNLGSGTIIYSVEGVTKILTCGHIFRDFNDDAKIEVDLFVGDQEKLHIARLEKFDLDADVGLISVPTDAAVSTVKIPNQKGAPTVGAAVASIGCSGGDLPTRKQLRVTDIDKYQGPHNIECTGLPVQGRSGGGLFNTNGEVVGVCIAADPEANRGLYAGLFAIHKLLDECSLTQLYSTASSTQEELLAQNQAPAATQPANQPAVTPPANPPQNPWVQDAPQTPPPVAFNETPPVAPAAAPNAAATNALAHNPLDVQSGNAEVVVIIRDKSQAQQPNRVVIIHNASSKFLGYLNGELDKPAAQQQPLSMTSRLPNTSVAQQPSMVRPASFVPPAPSKSDLYQTSKATAVMPRRYVRQ